MLRSGVRGPPEGRRACEGPEGRFLGCRPVPMVPRAAGGHTRERERPGPVARTWGPPWLPQIPSVPRRENCLLAGHPNRGSFEQNKNGR